MSAASTSMPGAFADPFSVRVPASSANLGPGFDSLGMALDAVRRDRARRRPARRIACRSPPSGDGRVRAGWAVSARRGCARRSRWGVGSATAGPSGSVVQWQRSCSGSDRAGASPPAPSTRSSPWPPRSRATPTTWPLRCSAAWWRPRVVGRSGCRSASIRRSWSGFPVGTTSTDHSRNQLPATVSREDAVHNIGHVAMLVAALAAGDTGALRDAASDRLHQELRLADAPMSQRALDAGLEHGAWCGWLSGQRPDDRDAVHGGRGRRVGGVAPRRRSHEGAADRPRRCRGRAHARRRR